jgi:hypothetical protein
MRLPLRLRSASPTEHRQVDSPHDCLSAFGQRHRPSTGRSAGLWPPQTPDATASPPSVSVTDRAQAGPPGFGRPKRPMRLPLRLRSASPTEHRQVRRALAAPNARCDCLSAFGQRATSFAIGAGPTRTTRSVTRGLWRNQVRCWRWPRARRSASRPCGFCRCRGV